MNPDTEFIVMEAFVRGSGHYKRVAVLEVVRGVKPALISRRARGVVRIVRTWERLHSGKGLRDQLSRGRREAEELAAELNWFAQQPEKTIARA